MVALLPSPVLQLSDSNGAPLAGGTIATFVPNTTTNKTTWSEPTGTVANSNPVVLNSAGECTIYADGAVRMVLSDVDGVLIWDQVSSTVVSSAMSAVCLAPDLATAQGLLGINPATWATLTTLTAGLAAANAAITAEGNRAFAAEAVLTTAMVAADADINWLNGLVTALATKNFKSGGGGPTDSTGHFRVVFPSPFTAIFSFVAQSLQTKLEPVVLVCEYDVTGADVWALNSTNSVPVITDFCWQATGQ